MALANSFRGAAAWRTHEAFGPSRQRAPNHLHVGAAERQQRFEVGRDRGNHAYPGAGARMRHGQVKRVQGLTPEREFATLLPAI